MNKAIALLMSTMLFLFLALLVSLGIVACFSWIKDDSLRQILIILVGALGGSLLLFPVSDAYYKVIDYMERTK